MKIRIVTAAFAGFAFWAAVATAQTPAPPAATTPDPHPTVNQRLENQKDRIQTGIKDDELTKAEATTVKADDAAIHAEEKVDRQAHDGKLTTAEQKQLNRQLNQNSRRIYRAAHNNRKAK